ncbi:MFS transporter [Helicobacter didelphidarum]|uniref:MFS transporter n=1 Tax=Helicobacter didelphidarum TaxID=2040648 RepID=A0A3D8IDM0_9HELI|nr:MFS transporter [Helicobacter didelphidarum]RDU63198.1 MFS transporter [Helicobacter didelphidarum]
MFLKILPFLSILIFRFIGLFIVLPVISLLIAAMPHANVLNVGLAIGAPYLFQMICQPIFGRLSDKYGRKPILILGLLIFFIGSIICMLETSIYYLIIGRCVQGIGAIGGLLTALVADSVREEKRTSAMALMGVGIFISFVVAMILGSILGGHYGLNSLFTLTTIVTIISLLIAIIAVKPTPKIKYAYPTHDVNIAIEKEIQRSIFAISASGFIEKFLMILTFSLTPIILNEYLEKIHFWYVYLPAVFTGIFVLGPTSIFSEKRGRSKEVLLLSILMFFIAYSCMAFFIDNIIVFAVGLAVFFGAFSIQEALLQSLISKYAKAKYRGAIIGDFSAAGFGGSFVGAMIGGYFNSYEKIALNHWFIFGSLMFVMLLWFFFVYSTIKKPHVTHTIYIPINQAKIKNLESLDTLDGIMEWYENLQENILTIKYNTEILDSAHIQDFINRE